MSWFLQKLIGQKQRIKKQKKQKKKTKKNILLLYIFWAPKLDVPKSGIQMSKSAWISPRVYTYLLYLQLTTYRIYYGWAQARYINIVYLYKVFPLKKSCWGWQTLHIWSYLCWLSHVVWCHEWHLAFKINLALIFFIISENGQRCLSTINNYNGCTMQHTHTHIRTHTHNTHITQHTHNTHTTHSHTHIQTHMIVCILVTYSIASVWYGVKLYFVLLFWSIFCLTS